VRPTLTHLALGVCDLDRTIAFYRKHARLHVVHERVEQGTRVVWLSDRETDVGFVIVLLPVRGEPLPAPRTLQHLGFAVASREEVDAAAAAGRADGVLALEPTYAGPIVGYFCLLADPDGNRVEFSFGQPINPKHLPKHLPPTDETVKEEPPVV